MNKSKGFTIIEVIVVVAIFSVLLPVIMLMMRNLFLSPKIETSAIEKIDQIRAISNKFINEIRSAVNCAGGSTVLTQASDFQIIFCIDSKKGSADAQLDKDKIRYYLSAGILYKGVISPTFTGSGYVYTSPEKITTVLTGLDTTVITPLFNYYDGSYDGSGSPLAQPITAMASVQFVKINLTVIKQNLTTGGGSNTSSWPRRKAITISNTSISSNLTNFPLLVSFNSDVDIGNNSLSTGYDIRFTDAGGSFLPYERETWSGGAGTPASGKFWVKVPTVSNPNPTTIYIYYGNSSANTDWTTTGSPTIAQSVWDANYKAVWHLNETGTNPKVYDSTANANNSVSQTWTPTSSGKINGAATGFATNKYISLNTPASLKGLQVPVTISGWFYQNAISAYQTLYSGYSSTSGGKLWSLVRIDSGTLRYFTSNSGGGYQYVGTFTPSINNWHYFSVAVGGTISSPTISITLDGNSQTPSLTALYATPDNTVPIYIGNDAAAPSTEYFNGKIDEVRVSSSARTANWIKFEYYNQSSANNELIFEGETPGAITSTNSFTITAGATIRSIRSQSGLGN